MASAIEASPARYGRPSDASAAADAIPILVDDEYHIFHLSTPPNTTRHPPRLRSTWSRLRSRDLVSWKRDDMEALYPGNTPDSPDADGAWTGSAIVGPDGNMHLFYTGYNLSQNGKQVILHARSNDKQASIFTKSPSPVCISGDRSQFEDVDFRDAHVSWNESEHCFWMLVATRLRTGPYWTRGCLALLTSSNLEKWTIDPKPFYAPNDMFCPECPEIFSLPNGKCRITKGTVSNASRKFWRSFGCTEMLDGQWSWGGDMGMPREVFADDHGLLVVRPSREYLNATLRSLKALSIPSKLELNSIGKTTTHFFPFDQSDFQLELSITTQDSASFGIMFRTDQDMKGTRLRFVPIMADLFDMSLLTCPPPLDDFWADQYNLHLSREVDGPEIARHTAVRLRDAILVAVRSDILEIFAGGRSISYRLPREASMSRGDQNVAGNGGSSEGTNGASQHSHDRTDTRELGVFVEDGTLVLSNISIKCGSGMYS
ncbi:glycoside hydrolase family 32 protein [Pleomassaria siparia CBS 279.74]|uniref:beta-fructofuranosidase n=1 Tax=Pleomassaria siparia CBS 279.74 TaxID=1314801 RepID=A0A6G1JTN8_9PLEO|nr:glycoside hydrolase family 32 protein [Pleomassaria siparia CBS 279.74]